MKFVTLNPRTKNVNLVKDVGLIPYYLHRLFGVDATVATYKNDPEYTYLETEVKGLKADFIRKRFGRQIDGMLYVLKNGRNIDVLNVYHLNTATLLSEIAYRLVNRKGKIYLKLDMSREGLRTVLLKDPRGLIKRADIYLADVVSVETLIIKRELEKHFGGKIIYITNGCLLPDDDIDSDIVNSEHTILTVANFGTWEKASDTLMEAFALSSDRHDYNLKIIGSVAEDFKPFIEDFFVRYPHLKDRIIFAGEIHDRNRLLEEYKRARIFTLPSRRESFGIVLVEAAYEGCFLVTAEAAAAGYDVSDNGRFGRIAKTDDVEDLAKVFTDICTDKAFDWKGHAAGISDYAKKTFNWESIVEKLYKELVK